MFTLNESPIQAVHFPLADKHAVTVDIKRDDLIHPIISGNKWRKLRYLVDDAKEKGCDQLVSMGGTWSNHLHALAYIGQEVGFKTVGFVRGHEDVKLTPTLLDCRKWGMELRFTRRVDYAELRKNISWDRCHKHIPNSYWLSEGGFGELAMQGVMDIGTEITEHYDYIFVGCGSGATVCGLAKALPQSHIVGVGAFSGAEYLTNELSKYLGKQENWTIDTQHHCGGFAKVSAALLDLQAQIEEENNFELDQVYNAKTLLALASWITEGRLKSDSRVLVIHTGGLQGKRRQFT